MTSRLALYLVALCGVISSAATAQSAGPVLEPGLTSRVASLAIMKLPPMARQQFASVEWQVVERLQSLPVIQPADPAEQLKLIFEQVKGHIASPELLASAARAVVALSLPSEDASEGWVSFRTGVALRSQLADVNLGTVPVVSDAAAFAAEVRKDGEALLAQALEAHRAADGARLTDLRKKTLSAATRDLVAVWIKLLEIQAAPAKPVAVSDDAPPAQASVAPGETAPTPAEASRPPETARNTGPVAYIGNQSSKKFHRSGCHFGPGPKNTVPLRSREDAIRQGYEPCKVCKP